MEENIPEAVVESLRRERLTVQKKTFTKWANVHLQKYDLHIDDLFHDIGDGLRLMKLLEALTGEKLGKPAKGSARINKIENVSRCLAFLHAKKMRLENISSEDIVDGKPHLILGLLWTVILRCEIWQHQQQVEDGNNDRTFIPPPMSQTQYPVQKIAKDSLLLWCQTKTDGYPNVKVRDFHRSWRDGLAFNALIHSHVPALVDFYALKPHEHIYNLENAFSVASKQLGIPRLLDPEDVDTDNPDEKSILVYVSTFSKGLANIKKGMTGGKRIANVLAKMMDIEKLKKEYQIEAGELLHWIQEKIESFAEMEPPKSLEDIQLEISNFKNYRIQEKPEKNDMKNEIEALLFAIQMKRLGKSGWSPPEESSPAAIEKAWEKLERAEHEHEFKIRNQLKEQERMENLAYKFELKHRSMNEYLKEMQKILTDPNYGANIKQADATFKKHEAIKAGILARDLRLQALFKIADVLEENDYRRKDEILEWKNDMESSWNYVLRLLEAYDERFSHLRQVMSSLEEMDTILVDMKQMQAEMNSEAEPLDVESSLQKQAVREVQIASWGEAIRRLVSKIDNNEKMKDAYVVQKQLSKLQQTHESLIGISNIRRDSLEELLKRNQQQENIEEMMAWVNEKQLYLTADINCKDLPSALHLQKLHKAVGMELKLRKDVSEDIRDNRLSKAIADLEQLWQKRGDQIAFTIEVYQYEADACECDSWISEELKLLESLDYGTDELTSEALLRRHARVEDEITAYASEIQRLLQEAEKICSSASDSLKSSSFGISVTSQLNKKFSPSSVRGGSEYQMTAIQQIGNHQTQVETNFSKLQSKCQERRKRLRHSTMYFRFKDGCVETEKWLRKMERIIDQDDFENEEIEKCFQAYMTDIAAHGTMIENLKTLAETLETEKSDQAQTVKILFEDVNRRWQHLNELTNLKARNLKGFTSVLLAHRMCDEASAWLSERSKAETEVSAKDVTSFATLRRKQEAIERELTPGEERVKQALILSENVAKSYPEKKSSIEKKMQSLKDQWQSYQKIINIRKEKLEEAAGLQIFKTSAESLIEWANLMSRKLNVWEKISDMRVAESVAKEHKDLAEQIAVQNDSFEEAEQLGLKMLKKYDEVRPLFDQLVKAKDTVNNLWQEKEAWIRENMDLQIFNREADHLQRLCAGHDKLLDSAELGDTLGDVESWMRHHEAFSDKLKSQENRFNAFNLLTEKLIESGHSEKDYMQMRCEQLNQYRQNIKDKAEKRKSLLFDAFQFQVLKADAQVMSVWISEKQKLANDLVKKDLTANLPYRMKRQQTFEAEMAANKDRLQDICERGQYIIENSSCNSEETVSILEELSEAWNSLIDKLEENRKILNQTKSLKDFCQSVEIVLKKLEEIKKSAVSSNFGKDLRSVGRQLKELQDLEIENEKIKSKISKLIQDGNKLIEDENFEGGAVRSLIIDMQQKADAAELPLQERREKLEMILKVHQFKSDVDRELLWISEKMVSLSTDVTCSSLSDAQKHQKKLENLEVAIEGHKPVIRSLLENLPAATPKEICPVDVSELSNNMEKQWNHLIETFEVKKEKAASILRVQMFYAEATEIDSWILEKLHLLSNTEYGKDEDAVIKLLTKHKDLELEIDSYKGLVNELSNQAEVLIEANHPESKIVKNRMEVIGQEMRNVQKLCSVRRQKLVESKTKHEFNKETEELKSWIAEQMAEATSEEYGEDYEHVLLLNQNFEFFRIRIEKGSKRILQYEEFAKSLINSNCYFAEDVKSSLEYLSGRWSDLVESIEARAFKLEAASEIHRYHRDVTDILSRIHNYYRGMPEDLGNNLIHVQDLIKKHDKIENELLGVEAQVHLLLKDSQRLQDAYPGGNEEHIQMQLALVIEDWNLLQQKVASRKTQLLLSQRIHKFLSSVREEESWAKDICFDLESEVALRDVQQMENAHKILGADIEARLSRFQPLHEEGQSLLAFDIFHSQIEEKLKSLSGIEKKLQEAWRKRSMFVEQKKKISLFFLEAKQIQASYAKKEIQLCGNETKEIVEDIKNALKKHQEFQKAMDIQEEKFTTWKKEGEHLIKQNVEESPKIQEKIDDLSARRKRLLDFSSERTKTLTDTLICAQFKRDTLEAESWVQEKKNKLRMLLKGYERLKDEEKIKCLQKQQAVHAELEAHESFMNDLIEQSRNVVVGQEIKLRFELIVENWKEMKKTAESIRNDLLEARDSLRIHDYFEKVEKWIKEKELMIQANDTGKDYEHCIALQTKLDDLNTEAKVDETLMKEMRNLAIKLSRKEDQKGIYIRYERIEERWEELKHEMRDYRKKLENALCVHAFIKDVDDTIEWIREKTLILSTREETKELKVVEDMKRKLDRMTQDLTALEDKIKQHDLEARSLAQRHELSSGRIEKKMSQAQNEWSSLKEELRAKKEYADSAYTSLKFVKEVNDFGTIVTEMIEELEFGKLPSNSTDAQSLLRAHNDLKPQIITRQEEIKDLQATGNRIKNHSEISAKLIENSLKNLQDISSNLETAWQTRFKVLSQSRDLQIFLEKATQFENWLLSKEAFLANQDIGDSMSSVMALIRKHENFEESCFANFEKINEIEAMARDLEDHEDNEVIRSRFQAICQRKNALQEVCKRRRNILQDAKSLQQLLLDIYEISHWMSEKILQVESDESYRDLSNLLSKCQKHSAFEAEILANHVRVVDVLQQAQDLIEADHFASDEIRKHSHDLEQMWEKLLDATNSRKECLNDANNALQFNHKLEDVNLWLQEAETFIVFEDYDSNAVALQQSINKQQELSKEIEEYDETLRLLSDYVEDFKQSNNFSKDEMISNYQATLQRLRTVEYALQEKGTKLSDSLLLAELENDISDELTWIEENKAICDDNNYFNDVISVKTLLKNLEALETEISSRERLVSSVVERGRRFNSATAEAKVAHLEDRFKDLKDAISLRRLRLTDALQSETYYFEAKQAEMWIKEKIAQVTGYDIERDIYSVQAVQKKLRAVEAATVGFKQTVESLQKLSSSMIERGHFDSENLRIKQEELNDDYERLQQDILKRSAILREKEDYFLFERDIKDVISQLKAMSVYLSSDDHGRDVEHVESLLQKLDIFRNRLRGHESNVHQLQQQAQTLIDEGHTESQNVKELLQELEEIWQQCNDSTETRCKDLEAAKLIHAFNKSVDETVSWIYEKDVVLSSENYGHDLESIKTLLRHHDTLEGDLKAIDEQVRALEGEVGNLTSQFPDSEEQIREKHEVVKDAWRKCSEKATIRKDKLLQAEQLQSYFDEAREFHAWIYEMSALITSNEIPQDVAACEALIAQHEGYKSEIDARTRSFKNFEEKGQEIIASGHFMSRDIQLKIEALAASMKDLLELWEGRRSTYEQNLDLQLFKEKLKELESWLQSQEHNLTEDVGQSIEEVEYLLLKHEQFEKKLNIYEAKFQELVETTKLEENIYRKRQEDERKKSENQKLIEEQKLQDLRRKEEERLLEERERERTETQVIQRDESDDDYLRLESLPSDDYVFKPMGSKRFPKTPPSETTKASTPVIKRNKSNLSQKLSVPPTTAEGFLDRKKEFNVGGKRSTSRKWKTYYTVLCGQLLCFFKNKKCFVENNTAEPPVNIINSACTIPSDYHKKKYVFRLEILDGSIFLFEAPNAIKRDEWIKKISFTASLSPSKQLMMPAEEGIYDETTVYDEVPPVEPDETTRYPDNDPQSNRSSLSQSSYVTAAASLRSSSTIQGIYDEPSESSEEEALYSLPNMTPRGDTSLYANVFEEQPRRNSKSLPRETGTSLKHTDSKKRWKMFSLQRRT